MLKMVHYIWVILFWLLGINILLVCHYWLQNIPLNLLLRKFGNFCLITPFFNNLRDWLLRYYLFLDHLHELSCIFLATGYQVHSLNLRNILWLFRDCLWHLIKNFFWYYNRCRFRARLNTRSKQFFVESVILRLYFHQWQWHRVMLQQVPGRGRSHILDDVL